MSNIIMKTSENIFSDTATNARPTILNELFLVGAFCLAKKPDPCSDLFLYFLLTFYFFNVTYKTGRA